MFRIRNNNLIKNNLKKNKSARITDYSVTCSILYNSTIVYLYSLQFDLFLLLKSCLHLYEYRKMHIDKLIIGIICILHTNNKANKD